MIALAPLVGVPYSVVLIVGIFVLQLLLAFALTAFGVMIAVRIKQMQSFMGVTQMIVMPMFFISGALFPVSGLPRWLEVLNRLDPLTYAVEPMKRLVFKHGRMSPGGARGPRPRITWFGWPVPTALEVGRRRRARARDDWASRSGSSRRPSRGRPDAVPRASRSVSSPDARGARRRGAEVTDVVGVARRDATVTLGARALPAMQRSADGRPAARRFDRARLRRLHRFRLTRERSHRRPTAARSCNAR